MSAVINKWAHLLSINVDQILIHYTVCLLAIYGKIMTDFRYFWSESTLGCQLAIQGTSTSHLAFLEQNGYLRPI